MQKYVILVKNHLTDILKILINAEITVTLVENTEELHISVI